MLKRLIDIAAIIISLPITIPLLILISLLSRVFIGRGVIFSQERPGLNCQIFKLYKFRTMNDKRDTNGVLLPDKLRIVKFGAFLRSTSLDEIPSLWNVIRGEMSLVGPRPLLKEYIERYDSEQIKRHNVKPGITGLAQINGRNSISWDKKFEYDIWYVENHNLLLDLKILFLTVKKIFIKEGINQSIDNTMSAFRGSSKK